MKVRIKFRKFGVLKYIGHLDVMRFFQKAMRRADIPIAFTTGYSPHMIMSFAQPLGLGITSEAEYLDIELSEPITSEAAVRQLNQVMVPGIDVLSFRQIREEKKYSGMTIIAAADYLILPKSAEETALTERNSKTPVFPDSWEEAIRTFMDQPQIVVLKKTKKSEKEVDIRPMIHDFRLETSGIRMRLSAGSEANLKPELVMETFLDMFSYEGLPLHYHRTELYAGTPDADQPKYISLESLGKDIV